MAIAEIIKEKDHYAACAFPEQFRSLAEDSDMGFASLGSEFLEILDLMKEVFYKSIEE